MTAGIAVNLGGAHQRLLPEAIPLRFFGTATIAQVLAWAAVIIVAADIPGYQGGPGPVAAAFHLLTVGVLLSTAMGASLQMLPVALGRAAPGVGRCNAVFGLLLIGAVALLAGFALYRTDLIAAAAAALVASVALYGAAIVSILTSAPGQVVVRRHVWAAIICLGLGVLSAAVLAADYQLAILADHRAAALLHLMLMVYGFMGLLAFGLSQILIPMFAIAEARERRLPNWAFALALAALATAAVALAAGAALLLWLAVGLGLAAAVCHGVQMEMILARRIRRRLGGEFWLIRLSWVMLPVSLLLAGTLAAGLPTTKIAPLFGFCVLFGWLLSLVAGVQQRILPFLGSMHAVRAGTRPLAPAKLSNEHALQVHRWSHIAALAITGGGIATAEPWIIRMGGTAGVVGAAAYAVFAVTALQRTRRHLKTAPTTQGRIKR